MKIPYSHDPDDAPYIARSLCRVVMRHCGEKASYSITCLRRAEACQCYDGHFTPQGKAWLIASINASINLMGLTGEVKVEGEWITWSNN
jgi:hypothetical protein